MMRLFLYLLFCMTLLFPHRSEGAASKEAKKKTQKEKRLVVPSFVKRIVSRQQRMSLAFFRQLRKNKGNLLFAPHGVSVVLSMLLPGARGATARGMRRALFAKGISTRRWHKAMRWLNDHMRSPSHKGVTWKAVQNFWVENTGMPKVSFIRTMQRYYRTAPLLMNFAKQPEVARKQINDWFRLQTKGMIPSFLPKGTINKQTRVVIGDALFFQGAWEYPFQKSKTKPGTFYLSKRRIISTPMMYQKRKFRYAARGNLQVVELPYVGHQFSMLVFLPQSGGLARLEKRFNARFLRRWMRRLRSKKIYLFLPRFEFKSNWNLVPAMSSLGMTRAMGPKADFSNINGKQNLYLAAALQKAKITVNEKGTKASAATGMSAAKKNGHSYPEFLANRSFLFVILDRRTQQFLFVGRLANPNPKAKARLLPLPKTKKRARKKN